MNKSALKKYAPQARLDFIAAVTRRAELLGLNPKSPAQVEKQGEALLINGRAFPAAYGQMRTTLEARIREQGFTQVMEAMAYTWFNRLVAIRYMELHGFLDHGYRVLSHPANKETGHTQPEILDHIADLELPGLDKSVALELKLAGNKDEELYREVLLAQCHALHQAMPFLFESLDDATELLLPDGLLRTDSILGKLVTAIDEADWQDVEIIGWLYQFYISEKKDQVIGKVVKSEDIPAATQLFTPNWIVKYLVQNSLGRLWLMANPTSTLASKWEYYIKPAEQTEEVNAQLDALIQTRIDEDGATLNPESLTLLDPACGSGHILVEAYDLLRDIYLERGYRRQDIPRLILEKNLYGLDIDDRAAQLAGFALLMKARADDRRLFGQPAALNVLALQEAKEGISEELYSALNAPLISHALVSQLVDAFEQAKTFGSLIQIPADVASTLPDFRRELEAVRSDGDMLGRDAAEILLRLVTQAEVLAKKFDAVVANPPYMGSRMLNPALKKFVRAIYRAPKGDLFAASVLRYLEMLKKAGASGFMTPATWLTLGTYEEFREHVLTTDNIANLILPQYHTFFESAAVPVCAFTAFRWGLPKINCDFYGLEEFRGAELQPIRFREAVRDPSVKWHHIKALDRFLKVPGKAITFELADQFFKAFSDLPRLSEAIDFRQGMATTDNDRFLRLWHEVDFRLIGLGCKDAQQGYVDGKKWFPYNKGGEFRKWYGNNWHIVLYENDGEDLLDLVRSKYPNVSDPEFVIKNRKYYFRPSITWSALTIAALSVRWCEQGFIFDTKGQCGFSDSENERKLCLGLLNSAVASMLAKALAPTMDYNAGTIGRLPLAKNAILGDAINVIDECVDLSKFDWDSFERSWDFDRNPLCASSEVGSGRVLEDYNVWRSRCDDATARMEELEKKNDLYFYQAYKVEKDLDRPIAPSLVSLTIDPRYRYDRGEQQNPIQRLQTDTAKELVSYSIGCMMGRYSLDAPGLIYAHAGNEGFDPSRYNTFPADDDGIVTITDEPWFDDDGANRIREFVRVVWGEDTEAENMAWLAESLGQKASESADDTIRRYLSRDFYKDHLQTYKKRPIYWLFSSGKHKAFEALVYLHRYNAGTLSRMRMEYVVPLQSRMQARIDNLEQDIQSSTSSAEQKRFQKQKDKLIKQLDELRRFDENLRHYADQRITLDLDDGVKVNYGKFGDLLAEVKAVTGKKG
jgi:type II restriction/modification system DNA methylase subunit YeeA